MSVKSLAAPFATSPAAITKHLKILERACLISRSRRGREHILQLERAAVDSAMLWLEAHQASWNKRRKAVGKALRRNQNSNGAKQIRKPAERNHHGA